MERKFIVLLLLVSFSLCLVAGDGGDPGQSINSGPIFTTVPNTAPTTTVTQSTAFVQTDSASMTTASTVTPSTAFVQTDATSMTTASAAPADTTPASTALAGTTVASTAPASTTAGSTAPADTTPASTAPASTTPASTAPASTIPASTAPAGATPASTAPASTTVASTVTPKSTISTNSALTFSAVPESKSSTTTHKSVKPTSATSNIDESEKDQSRSGGKTLLIVFAVLASVVGAVFIACYLSRRKSQKRRFRRLFNDNLLEYESGIHTMDSMDEDFAQTSFNEEVDTGRERVIYRPVNDDVSPTRNSRLIDL